MSEYHNYPRKTLLSGLPNYPFFPCRICVGKGFEGVKSCDHTVFERARAMHPSLVAALANETKQ